MDVSIGQTATREVVVTEDMVAAYAEVTGDRNPLHFDAEFAAGTRFERLIAQGGIATGLLHALVAMDMPGPGSVFLNQSWNFPKPVYIGDTITATATATSVHERRGIVRLGIVIENQEGEAVLTGEATVMQVEPLASS